MSTSFHTASPEETRALGAALGRVAERGDLLLLQGPLGAGKTVFVQGLAAGLRVGAAVRSPTFVLVAEYAGRVPLVHVDLYRIEHPRALEGLGLEERLDAAVVAIEWGERYRDAVTDGVQLTLEEESGASGGRRIVAHAIGARGRDWLARWQAAAVPGEAGAR